MPIHVLDVMIWGFYENSCDTYCNKFYGVWIFIKSLSLHLSTYGVLHYPSEDIKNSQEDNGFPKVDVKFRKEDIKFPKEGIKYSYQNIQNCYGNIKTLQKRHQKSSKKKTQKDI